MFQTAPFLQSALIVGNMETPSRENNYVTFWNQIFVLFYFVQWIVDWCTREIYILYSELLIDAHVKFNYNNYMYIRLWSVLGC